MIHLALRIDRRNRIILASVAGTLALFLVLHPLARSVAQSAARSRGWSVQSRSVRFSWRGLWMRGVHAQSNLPELHADLDAVLVPWSGMIGSRRLAVYGGSVHLPEDLHLLQPHLDGNSNSSRRVNANHWQVRFSGLAFSWQSMSHDARVTAWGVAGDAGNAACELRADRIEVGSSRVRGVLTQLDASMKRALGDWMLETAEVARMSIVVDQARGRNGDFERSEAALSSTVNAASPGGQNGGASHALGATAIRNVKRSRAAAGGKQSAPSAVVAVDSVSTGRDGVERAVDRLSRLRGQTERLRRGFAQHLASSAVATVRELDLRWQYEQQKLDIGPLHVQVKHDALATECLFEQRADVHAARRYLQVRVPNQPSRIELEANIGSVPLQTLGVKENDLGLRGVADTKLTADLKISIDELGSAAEWEAKGEIVDLNLLQPWLAPRPIEGIQSAFSGNGNLKWQPEFSLNVQNLGWSFGKARVEVSAQLQRKSDETVASMTLDIPLAACEDLVEALPRGLAPMASQVQLDGTLSLQSGVHFDTARPNAAEVRWKLANACRIKSVSTAVSPDRFRAPFILEVPDEHKVYMQRAFGPGTPSWVALADMSTHLTNAVLVCEDGGFFHHAGFDAQAIRNSIRENLVQGRFARGASTVSMQLAKNLYLRREKTFSRKLQEAVLTLLLEQSFTKNELIELYLNVVELGPGIYGVGEAARTYFNTTPAVLTPLQAYYLISLLPNPKVLHFEKDGHLSAGWLKLLRNLMTIANKRHYLSDDELKAALQDDLRFGVAESLSTTADAFTAGTDQDATADSYDATER